MIFLIGILNSHIGFIDVGTEIDIGINCRVLGFTTAGTEYEAVVHSVIHCICLRRFIRTYLTATDDNRTLTGIV